MTFRATSKVCRTIPSFGFSGAGFLTCYHLGVAKCLLEQGLLNFEPKHHKHRNHGFETARAPLLTGVSGGALTVAAVAAGVDPELGMTTTLAVAEKTRQEGGIFDSFRPGFSVLDLVEKLVLKDILNAVGGDTELLLRRIQGGRLLRIGLTNRFIQPHIRNPQAYCFVDRYRDAKDIVAACMLSSYVPGFSGPLSGSSPTLQRASQRIHEMADLGFIKNQDPGSEDICTVDRSMLSRDDREFPPFVDGGLSNGFPVIDSTTVLVTPIRGKFNPNRYICPPTDENGNLVTVNHRVKLYIDGQTVKTFRRILLSSDGEELQRQYSLGHDNAKQFLRDHNLETNHTRTVVAPGFHPVPLRKKKSPVATALLGAIECGSIPKRVQTSSS